MWCFGIALFLFFEVRYPNSTSRVLAKPPAGVPAYFHVELTKGDSTIVAAVRQYLAPEMAKLLRNAYAGRTINDTKLRERYYRFMQAVKMEFEHLGVDADRLNGPALSNMDFNPDARVDFAGSPIDFVDYVRNRLQV